MKQRHLLLVVLCTVMLLAVPATAKENMTGRFGVGGGSTLLGNGGLQVKYFAGHMGISMLVSYLNGS
ncbi:MAG: hypothetical protein FJ125_13510, partial [Deltaproteobacteria bacterium]|nr:hypothetical protein [Deltaproteobacteria bacterium]